MSSNPLSSQVMMAWLVLVPSLLIALAIAGQGLIPPEDRICTRPADDEAAIEMTSSVARQITLSPHESGMNANPLAPNNPAFVTQESAGLGGSTSTDNIKKVEAIDKVMAALAETTAALVELKATL